MKSFRKWWEKSQDFFNGAVHALSARNGWRGALEEVLKMTNTSDGVGAGLKLRLINDWIETELKDE